MNSAISASLFVMAVVFLLPGVFVTELSDRLPKYGELG